jgi:type III restriction enzyme
MENKIRLNTALNTQKGYISKITIPEYITDNLAFELREYQKEAIARFLYYNENDNIYDTNGDIIPKSPHLLWQMATGSGKTLIMAALILKMYKQGYRNFWFFVNAKDIITKTIDNFINSAANKYQFTQKVEIDGQVVQIRQVENFTNSNTETINIKFSSINILHQISQPENISENSIMLEDFVECPLVLIGDEAHHLNAATKKEEEEESTWENSVQLVLKTNPKNRLFEFTATANLTNKNILAKYEDKLLYNYDLKKFREDKYSKDVFTFSTDGDPEKIIMRAILISQYRKHIGSRGALKPVILFKSKGVKESKEYFEKFNQMIQNLTVQEIKKELNNISAGNDIWEKASHYFLEKFRNKESDLCKELRDDFDVDKKKILLHDGTNKRIADQPKLLATLEDNDNPVRAIFAVNMLSEGWDVLNLFDIVRLYDSRDGNYNKQGKYVPGTTTVSEAQLIGRGARYYPFEYGGIGDKYKRKFDDNENEPLRVIEQMHYHCKDNPRYISEIRSSLMEIGIIEDLPEIKLKMKEDFINGKNKNFQEKNVYENKIIEKEELNIEGIEFVENEIKEQKISFLPDFSKNEPLEIDLATGFSKSQALLKNNIEMQLEVPKEPFRGNLSEIVLGKNIIRYALNSNKNFNFDKLQKAYPKLESMSQFFKILGQQEVIIFSHKKREDLTPDDLLFICKEVLNSLVPTIKEEQKKVIVAKHF